MGSVQLGEDLNDIKSQLIATSLQSLTRRAPDITYPILPAETADPPRPSGGREGELTKAARGEAFSHGPRAHRQLVQNNHSV